VDLHERAVRALRFAEPEPARRREAEHHRRCLVVAQHQRRQPIAGAEAIAAADAALTLDRDPEALQRRNVAPDRAAVDGELVGDLAAGHERLRLKQLQQLEEA
jgi:hypothetical protein